MCSVCGCSNPQPKIEGVQQHEQFHHRHSYGSLKEHVHDHGTGPAHAHAPGLTQARMVQVEQDIFAQNNQYAATNRSFFNERNILALNLVSSPGSGKTTLLIKTIEMLKHQRELGVIEGDQQTSQDADRIRATGVKSLQINTGKGCHLDAHMVGHALQEMELTENSLLFIENVGNLVCPAGFDLGEANKVVVLSVTEGEDKPLKYPDMFEAAGLVLLNKVDLLPYLDFDKALCLQYMRQVNPHIKVLQVSAKSGAGMHDWIDWLQAGKKNVT